MSSSRLVKQVYTYSRARYEAGESSRWCKYTHALLTELGMADKWQQGQFLCDMTTWDKEVREKIHEREEKEWLARMQTKTSHIHHQTQTHIRTLLSYMTTQEHEIMTRLRGGTNELRIEKG